jgi:hypothetical protein
MRVGAGYLDMTPGFVAGTSDFSVEFWFKTSDTNLDAPILGSDPLGPGCLGIIITNGGTQLEVTDNGATTNIIYTFLTPLLLDTWAYFAISRSGTTESVWVDGIASPLNTQSDSKTYTQTDTIFITDNIILQNSNVTNIKVNIGKTYLDPTLPTIPIPTNSLTVDPETKLLMNTLLAGSVFADTSGNQTSITNNVGSVSYRVDSPY